MKIRAGIIKRKAGVSIFFIILSPLFAQAANWPGSGTAENPYLIRTPSDFNTLGTSPSYWNKYFKLIADIDLSAYKNKYQVIGSYATPFTGSFDGDGHSICNLELDYMNVTLAGVFGRTSNAIIANLGVKNLKMHVYSSYAGALIAYQEGGTAVNCFSSGSVYAYSYSNMYIGGLIGYADTAVIKKCFSTCSVEAFCISNNIFNYLKIGGLIGPYENSSVSNCYTTSPVKAHIYSPQSDSVIWAGGFAGYVAGNSSNRTDNCYSTGTVYAEFPSCYGGFIGIFDGYQYSGSGCFWDKESSGIETGIGNGTFNGVTGKTTSEMQTLSTFTNAGWDFVDETANGTNDYWRMPVKGYPRLEYENFGDFNKDETVNSIDLAIMSCYWLESGGWEQGDINCDGTVNWCDFSVFANQWPQNTAISNSITDITKDGRINFKDLAVLANHWIEVCGLSDHWCDGADVDRSGKTNFIDFQKLAKDWLKEDKIESRIESIDICYGKSYDVSTSVNKHSFEFEITTNDSVEKVMFTTPAGNTFEITKEAYKVQQTYVYFDIGRKSLEGGKWKWWYKAEFPNVQGLGDYGDGEYKIKIYCNNNKKYYTKVWFGIPGTANPITMPLQVPVITSFINGTKIQSPVTISWEHCTDPYANKILCSVYNTYGSYKYQVELPIAATGLGSALDLQTNYFYYCDLAFEAFYQSLNADNILIKSHKYLEANYGFLAT
ncbi:MAG: dockerin type I domain-containing protein [Phycisphaerales bacterium]